MLLLSFLRYSGMEDSVWVLIDVVRMSSVSVCVKVDVVLVVAGESVWVSASVVPARLGLKAVGKARLFAASAFQNWSLSRAHRLGPAQARPRLRLGLGSGRGLWEICQVTFTHAQKKNQVTSFGWQRRDNIYICIFNSFSYIYMNLKSFLPCFTI